MESSRRCLSLIAFVFGLIVVLLLVNSVSAQGLMRGSGLDLAPTNPLGTPSGVGPQGSNSLYLNSGMLRDIVGPIPNLEIGYLYQFGNKIRTGRLTLDYVLPATVRNDQAVFAEAHGEFTNFWKTIQRLFKSGDRITSYSGYPERTDLSFGGGYRKIFGDNLFLGVNAFADTTKLADQWYGSGGLGFEMAALGIGHDLVELNFNFYGDIFQGRNSIINAFRNGPGNYDASVAYSVQLGADGPDLRLKLTGYRFDIGTAQYGGNADAELKSKNGVFSLRGGVGHDPVNGWYHTVGGFVNVGVQFSRIFSGESPFTAPEPIFKSPRNLRRLLSRKVDRNYISPPAAVARTGVAVYGSVCANQCPVFPSDDALFVSYAIIDTPVPEFSISSPVPLTPPRTIQANTEYVIHFCVETPPPTDPVVIGVCTPGQPLPCYGAILQANDHTTYGPGIFIHPSSTYVTLFVETNSAAWTPGCITIYAVPPR